MEVEYLLLNYGLAGVVVYVFYKLISNDLRDLRDEIKALREEIRHLSTVIKNSVGDRK